MYKQLKIGVSAGMCVSAVTRVLQERFVCASLGNAVWRQCTGFSSPVSHPPLLERAPLL